MRRSIECGVDVDDKLTKTRKPRRLGYACTANKQHLPSGMSQKKPLRDCGEPRAQLNNSILNGGVSSHSLYAPSSRIVSFILLSCFLIEQLTAARPPPTSSSQEAKSYTNDKFEVAAASSPNVRNEVGSGRRGGRALHVSSSILNPRNLTVWKRPHFGRPTDQGSDARS